MKSAEFDAIFEELTPRQRKVLQGFLTGATDEVIATTLTVETATIRRHLANICKDFGLHNTSGEHYSHREDLRSLFELHCPELVKPGIGYEARSLEFPGSPLAADSTCYLDRPPIEDTCIRELHKPGALIRIRAPQRMGKTSLLNRLLASAQAANLRAIRIDLRQAGASFLTDLDTFLHWFCTIVSHKLGVPLQLEELWDCDRLGSMVSCTAYFQAYLLEVSGSSGLLLGLDEVDWLFQFPTVAQGFFALLRSWHEEAKNLEIWQTLRLVVVHSTEVYIPLNIHQSPFNVGLPIRLSEWTLEQVQQLAQRYGVVSLNSRDLLSLVQLVGGHPYLIQLALYYLQTGMILPDLLATAATQTGIYSSYLRQLFHTVHPYPELAAALQQAIAAGTAGTPLKPTLAYRLESLGLITLQGNTAALRCDLYRRYFQAFSSSA